MVAVSHGSLITLLSTPYGRRGFFYRTWEQGAQAGSRLRSRRHNVPGSPQKFLTQENFELGPHWYSQEYECQFIESVYSVFLMGDVSRRRLTRGHKPAFPGLSFESVEECHCHELQDLPGFGGKRRTTPRRRSSNVRSCWKDVTPANPVKLDSRRKDSAQFSGYPDIVDYTKDVLFPRVRRYAAEATGAGEPFPSCEDQSRG